MLIRKNLRNTVVIVSLFFSFNMICAHVNINKEKNVIKVAILDQIRSQKISSIYYELDYKKGIELASKVIKKDGFKIIYKYYQYGKLPLGIIKLVPELKKWKPNIIIGPRSSSHFLMLRDEFHNLLVVSPIATDEQVKKLPKNFYSFTRTDVIMSRVLFDFIKNHLTNVSNIIIITASDCKSCTDIGKKFKILAQSNHITTEEFHFLSGSVERMNITKIIKNYKPGTLIFTPNLSYVSSVLVSRLVNNIAKKNMIFMASDEWGAYDVGYVGKFKSQLKFSAYHVQNWSLDSPSKKIRYFLDEYKNYFGKEPNDNITFSTYHALQSVVSTLKLKDYVKANSKSLYIAKTFRKYVNEHPVAFLQDYYVIYKRSQSSDKPVYIEKVI